MQKVQERLSAICGALADVKAIKLLGLSKTVIHNVAGLRDAEVNVSQGYRVLLMWSLFIGMFICKALSIGWFVWHSLT